MLLHGGAGYGGVKALQAAKPLATGRERLYHGTHEGAAPLIREKGLRPRSEIGGHGITDILPESVREQGKKLVYMTPNKMEARSYAMQADAIQRAGGEVGIARLNMAMNPAAQMGMLNPLNNKGIVKADVPTWKLRQQGRLHANPELEGLSRKAWVDKLMSAPRGLFQAPPNRFAAGQAYKSLEKARVIEGGVGAEHMVGNSKFQRLGLRELGEYARAHPGRMAGGLGLGALGVGALGYAASGLRSKRKKEAMATEEHGLAVARVLLKTASEGNLLVPLGKALRRAGEGAKYVHHQAGRAGAGIAEGLGTGETGQLVGRRAAQAAAAGTGLVGAKKGKRKVDEFRYRHGLYGGM
jgi:hypothetical protein